MAEPEPEYADEHELAGEERWMKPYIDFNTEKRKLAKNDFEKDFFKLMCNSCFGKTMENLRNRIEINFVTSSSDLPARLQKRERTIERRLASPLYDGHIIYNEHLAAIKQKKKSLKLNKPIYAGMCILDLSKLHMYDFHCDVIKKQYGDRAKLLFTDTDSLCYHIKTDNFYQDMHDSKELYDMSNFDKSNKFYDDSNKKVLGKFKDVKRNKDGSFKKGEYVIELKMLPFITIVAAPARGSAPVNRPAGFLY